MEWKPMDEAPKDGTAILSIITGSHLPHVIRWHRDRWIISWDGYDLSSDFDLPVLWMSLPDAPNA